MTTFPFKESRKLAFPLQAAMVCILCTTMAEVKNQIKNAI
jgi:hypothetical protein